VRPAIVVGFVLALLVSLSGGCQTQPPAERVGLIPVNSLMMQWALPLALDKRHDEIRGLYLRDNTLYVYSQRNLVTAISADGGKPLWAAEVTLDELPLKPPLIVKDRIVFPTGTSLEVHALKDGKPIYSMMTPRSIRSPGAVLGNTVYIGLDYPNGGRLAAMDVSARYATPHWEVMSRAGIEAAPAVHGNTIYFADANGTIFAVTEDKAPAWALEHSAFDTDGSIVADLVTDEGAVYAASMDSKIYCLDAATGRVRWQYYSTVPLVDSPVVTSDTVYQPVPGVGVVAIDKAQGKLNRDAKWIAYGARRFLSQDEKFVYLLGGDRRVMACDKTTGEIKFRGQRNDFVAFAANTKSPTIYASTRNGRIVAIMPVTKPGTVGTLVLAPATIIEPPVAVASR